MRTTSDYVYARPSFAEGVARILDFGNTLGVYNAPGDPGDSAPPATPADPDEVALRLDWAVIGDDFRRAVGQFTVEEADKLTTEPAQQSAESR